MKKYTEYERYENTHGKTLTTEEACYNHAYTWFLGKTWSDAIRKGIVSSSLRDRFADMTDAAIIGTGKIAWADCA